jgi:hypothetical protein
VYNTDHIDLSGGDIILIYLDNCAFNRPMDNQTQVRVRLEVEK